MNANNSLIHTNGETSFLSHVDRGRAQDDVGLMGQTDMRSREEKGAVNEA